MMLSQGEAPLRSTCYFLNTDGCRGNARCKHARLKGGWGGAAPGFGFIAAARFPDLGIAKK